MIKRSQSVSQQLSGKPSNDLLGLGIGMGSSAASNASTPISTHPYAPLQSPSVLQSPSQLTLNSPTLSSSRYADLTDLFSEVGEIQPATTKSARQTPTPTSGYMSIPRPPSRKSEVSKNVILLGVAESFLVFALGTVFSKDFKTTLLGNTV